MKNLRAIHQFHVGSAYGDGVTNGMLLTRRLLRSLGLQSEIYAVVIPPELQGDILPHVAYRHRSEQLLLVHHSMGHELDGWIEAVTAPKVLIYHNITPSHYFPENDRHRAQSILGRQQLADWARAGIFAGAIAASPFNGGELESLGYTSLAIIPLLVDLDRLRSAALQPAPSRDDTVDVLFVGRLTEHKCQHDIINAFATLRGQLDRPARLTLVGQGDPLYVARLTKQTAKLGLKDSIRFTGRLTNPEVHTAYRRADLFLCLSEHEGFGMPLLEAAAFGVPIVAYASGNIPDTVGEGGVLLDSKTPEAVTTAVQSILQEPAFRRKLLEGQTRTLNRYDPNSQLEKLIAFLLRLGFSVPHPLPREVPERPVLRIEGPVTGSYSLAIVNRELALGLDRLGVPSSLRSTEDGGARRPDAQFMSQSPDATELWRRDGTTPAEATLFNNYPPEVDCMSRSRLRGLACYAWEETGFPVRWVNAFNRTLDVATVTSEHVRKTLTDNGVHTPIAVVGNGVDHILRVASLPPPKPLPDGFCFLHISSCFPRKGPDALLQAWVRAFRRDDPVALIIKTFPNPHQTMAAQLAELVREYPDHAPVMLIDEDMEEGVVRGLYEACDAFVAPTRCEGFGLPLAEAMLLGKPVIATAFSGQMDFCSPETAWLVDWRYAPSRSHLDLPCSAWADPDVHDLARQLRAVFEASPDTRTIRTKAAQKLVSERYTWDAVATRVRAAVETVRHQIEPPPLPRVAMVTTWNSRCGIATYSSALANHIPPLQLRILANADAITLGPDGPSVERPWRATRDDSFDDLHQAVAEFDADTVVLQFNFGLYGLEAFGHLITRLADEGRSVFIIFHSTADVDKPGLRASLRDIRPALASAKRLLVHSISDLNRMKDFGLVDNVTLFPHGFSVMPAGRTDHLREQLGFAGKRVLGSFGFLLPHKGLRELVHAFKILHQQDRSLHLLMLNALYPAWDSEAELDACRSLIKDLNLERVVTLRTDYLEEAHAIRLLSLAEAIVYPYQHTQESVSGAVRLGLATGKPVAVTPLAIFDDVAPVVHRLPGFTPEAIADGLSNLLADERIRNTTATRQSLWLDELAWPRLSQRLWNLVRGQNYNFESNSFN